MPVSPSTLAQSRAENTVNRLCDLIDKKLHEHDASIPFTFHFLPHTPTYAREHVAQVYAELGWHVAAQQGADGDQIILTEKGADKFLSYATQKAATQKENGHPAVRCKRATTMPMPALPVLSKHLGRHEVFAENPEEFQNFEFPLPKEDQEVLVCHILENVNTALALRSVSRKVLTVNNAATMASGYTCRLLFFTGQEITESVTPYILPSTYLAENWNAGSLGSIYKLGMSVIEYIQTFETRSLLFLLSAVALDQASTIETYVETTSRAFRDSFSLIDMAGDDVSKIILHPLTLNRIVPHLTSFESAGTRDRLMTGLAGFFDGTDVYTDANCNEEWAYVLPSPLSTGGMWVPQDGIHIDSLISETSAACKLSGNGGMYVNPDAPIRRVKIRF